MTEGEPPIARWRAVLGHISLWLAALILYLKSFSFPLSYVNSGAEGPFGPEGDFVVEALVTIAIVLGSGTLIIVSRGLLKRWVSTPMIVMASVLVAFLIRDAVLAWAAYFR